MGFTHCARCLIIPAFTVIDGAPPVSMFKTWMTKDLLNRNFSIWFMKLSMDVGLLKLSPPEKSFDTASNYQVLYLEITLVKIILREHSSKIIPS